MALIIKPKQENKINLNGTPIFLDSLYLRIEFYCNPSGKSISAFFSHFYNKSEYEKNKSIGVLFLKNGEVQNVQQLDMELKPEESQSVDTVHSLSKKAFEELGFEVEIDL